MASVCRAIERVIGGNYLSRCSIIVLSQFIIVFLLRWHNRDINGSYRVVDQTTIATTCIPHLCFYLFHSERTQMASVSATNVKMTIGKPFRLEFRTSCTCHVASCFFSCRLPIGNLEWYHCNYLLSMCHSNAWPFPVIHIGLHLARFSRRPRLSYPVSCRHLASLVFPFHSPHFHKLLLELFITAIANVTSRHSRHLPFMTVSSCFWERRHLVLLIAIHDVYHFAISFPLPSDQLNLGSSCRACF